MAPFSKSEIPIEDDSADDILDVLGYQSELTRSRSTLQVAFMSFVLAAVPYGLATTLYYPLVGGGPVSVIWGWIGVCSIMACLAVSLGEITSVYPTAGGVYYQTFMLSPTWCRNVAAWICGWSYFLGNMLITLSVNFGTTLYLIGCINIFTDSEGNGIFPAKQYETVLIFFGITIVCNATSSLGNKWLPVLDTFAVFWTFTGVIAIIVCILAIAKEGRHSAAYAFGHFESSSGYIDGWSFCIGLLHAAYALSATGMILSMCEEVQKPATQVPKAMVGTVFLNAFCGFIFLVPLMFVLPDIAVVLATPTGQPFPVIIRTAIDNEVGAFLLTLPIIILGFICGVGCTTASSRCAWAFARDGAIPGSRLWKQVNKKLEVPLNAMMLCMVTELALGCVYFGSAAAFNAFNGSGVIFLTLSYVIPIFVSFVGGRSHLVGARYNLGVFGWICNVVAIGWCLFITPLFSMPAVIPTTPQTMNYACVVFVGFMTIAMAWYFVWGRKHYTGPAAKEEEVRRRRSSAAGLD